MSPLFPPIRKYPRTRHVADSCLQPGDDGSDRVAFSSLKGCYAVYEEKVDGANSAFRFDGGGELFAQSRGHYLNLKDRNAPRERDWSIYKEWLQAHHDVLLERFEDRFIVYGEWMGTVHSVFYNNLPSLFLEFDIYDTVNESWLDTTARWRLCQGLPVVSVPAVFMGPVTTLEHMKSFVGDSVFRTPPQIADWRESLRHACSLVGDDYEKRLTKIDDSGHIEGIYIKIERDGRVVDRLKWVRPGFLQTILAADEHWQSRFPVPNLLGAQADIFPGHLVRDRNASPVPYDSSKPWEYAPWIAGATGEHVPGGLGR
jgi:hypothetical protein